MQEEIKDEKEQWLIERIKSRQSQNMPEHIINQIDFITKFVMENNIYEKLESEFYKQLPPDIKRKVLFLF